MQLKLRLVASGSIASIALALTIGCDKPATAGGSTSVIRGAPINKPTPAESVAPASPPTNAGPPAAPAPAEPPDTRLATSPDIAKKPPATVENAESNATNDGASVKPDRATLLRAKKLPMDDKTPVGTPDRDKPDYVRVNFDDLASYDYDPFEAVPPDLGGGGAQKAGDENVGPQPEPAAPAKNAQIPERIMALHKKKIIVQGFMVPIEFKRDSVRSFLLVRNQMMCCFGAMIGMNEWVMVQMDGERRTSFVQDVPTTVFGELEVGEDIQNGMVMSLYRLRGFEVQFKGGR